MSSIISINHKTLTELSNNAKISKRKRLNYNFHYVDSDPIQRLLNALEPDTYIAPHKHENPDKREVFILLKGKMRVLIFNDCGKITESFNLNHHENLIVEIPSKTWHTIISLQEGSVYYEVKDGPYDAVNDKNFAPWAPAEGNHASGEYLNELKRLTNS